MGESIYRILNIVGIINENTDFRWGNNQLNAIKRVRQMGHEVVLVDYFDNPPGKRYANFHEVASTFDIGENMI